ncbi:MAG: NAD-glutamate dehydrogenase domain-containing protein [Methylohalobius sp.]
MSWQAKFQAKAGSALAARYREAFPEAYRRAVSPSQALKDVAFIEERGGIGVDLWLDEGQPVLRFYSLKPGYLDEWLPPLQNLGFRVVDQDSFQIRAPVGAVYLRCFTVETQVGMKHLAAAREAILGLLAAQLAGKVEDDRLSGLALVAALDWRLIDVLRGYRNYYLQLTRDSRARFHQALLDCPQAARLLCEYFRTRFDPDLPWPSLEAREEEGLLPLRLKLQEVLAGVEDLKTDRLLRMLFNLIDATVRTNFFLPGAEGRLAFKLSGLGVIEMPAPKPLFEIYVHSPCVEAVHLRASRVARGGIRWSDRDDFRTEVWELMRTQMLKNALIVPQGAKGGFIVKRGDPKQAYITFMRALLDLTDNLEDGRIVHPPRVLCYDGDDYYLVVAADKGTAYLSDTANQVAAEYRFWLKDAFASGGSSGYDHKRLGITAKGAFECARRHFRELGRDLDNEIVTVVGIGSMDGDVFGNGMLLSRRIKLLAAFSGQHIFLDPDPDPAISYLERRRLFEQVAGWDQYDRSLISEGGGVWPRAAKEILLSPKVRRWLGIRQASLDGEQLIRHLLTAEADLLWLGGIGTYIKASDEKNEAVGDPANDSVRVDACELKVKVVAEGANLGFTQKGRVEYALKGGKINLDAIDNSGGVDLSDHEVNLKILLYQLKQTGQLQEDPVDWLADLEDEVVMRVLAHNAAQALCLSLELERCRRDALPFLVLADRLENAGTLDRQAEDFPDREEVLARPEGCLTRPELAVLLSHAKMQFKQALLERSDFLRQDWLQPYLQGYFPGLLVERYRQAVAAHPLAPEITVTNLANFVLDRAGATFLTWMEDVATPLLERAVGLYLTFDAVLGGQTLRAALLARERTLGSARLYALLLRIEDTLAQCCCWFLERGRQLDPDSQIITRGQEFLQIYLKAWTIGDEREFARLAAEGLPEASIKKLVGFAALREFPALVDLALDMGGDFSKVARAFRQVAEFLGLPGLLDWLARMPARSEWESRLKQTLKERLQGAGLSLARHLIKEGKTLDALLRSPRCLQKFSRFQRLRREIERCPPVSLIPLAVLSLELEGILDTLNFNALTQTGSSP